MSESGAGAVRFGSSPVIGHRGASGYRPEHTASAYRLAFALGAELVEPDVVLSRDGVPVVRHENEISGTTDVAERPEFADRRTSKTVDGIVEHGWFAEDFTWAELATLRARERLPSIRPASAAFDGTEGVLRLRDVLEIAAEAGGGVVVEIKHATYFAGLGMPIGEIVAGELREAGWGVGVGIGAGAGVAARAGLGSRAATHPLVIESFEKTVLLQLRAAGVQAQYVYLLEATGAPFDEVALHGAAAAPYAASLTDAGLRALAGEVDGVSLDKDLILVRDADGRATGVSDVVARAQRAGLSVFTWTLRAENEFLPVDYRVSGAAGAFGRWEDEFGAILGSGVDGVFADQPDLAVRAVRALQTVRPLQAAAGEGRGGVAGGSEPAVGGAA
ncbi:glycerophosphodiester phosphodiesterase family protein [Herbiconiux solani]|uniref:glycerophosphodiester phosphodiesterase family protein n=1 Tax=Herbiconiux solani TaxID=661329 RepID=UPI000A056053|nr:glycerophosphodiester phosphodiesterase family protein [Herbiconiux solani]